MIFGAKTKLWLFFSGIRVSLCPSWSLFMTKVKVNYQENSQHGHYSNGLLCVSLEPLWSPASLSTTVSYREACMLLFMLEFSWRSEPLEQHAGLHLHLSTLAGCFTASALEIKQRKKIWSVKSDAHDHNHDRDGGCVAQGRADPSLTTSSSVIIHRCIMGEVTQDLTWGVR